MLKCLSIDGLNVNIHVNMFSFKKNKALRDKIDEHVCSVCILNLKFFIFSFVGCNAVLIIFAHEHRLIQGWAFNVLWYCSCDFAKLDMNLLYLVFYFYSHVLTIFCNFLHLIALYKRILLEANLPALSFYNFDQRLYCLTKIKTQFLCFRGSIITFVCFSFYCILCDIFLTISIIGNFLIKLATG